ncbi:ly-6/neurotoxin-like protein 1 [Oncorhynchus kisutch]|uniref:ly-6/neurotoxin-like protein 1 n=1 Tax=Oncorhynchus kisutch TaxID=8019 RepID=UPI0009A044E5|nr:ly-6/neurotoxin-like protein 1 [Oncorhynchus kisutch]
MKSNILIVLTVLVVFIAVAQSLTCKQCSVGIFGTCFFPKNMVCDNSTLNCFTGEAKFNSTGFLTLHTRGCLDSDLCGKTITATIFSAGVTSSSSCCQTDLCNGASSVQVSVTVALSAALMAWGV